MDYHRQFAEKLALIEHYARTLTSRPSMFHHSDKEYARIVVRDVERISALAQDLNELAEAYEQDRAKAAADADEQNQKYLPPAMRRPASFAKDK